MIKFKKLTGIVAIAVFTCIGLKAQTKNEAIEAYNQAIGFMKTDVQSAIQSFEKSIKICEQVGDSATELKDKAIQVLPDLYYQKAYKLYAAKKMPEAIAAGKEAMNASEKYKNDKVKDKSQRLLEVAYAMQGSTCFKNNDNDNAIKYFDSTLLINPNYSKAILNKALIYNRTENTEKFTETIDAFIEKVKGDTTQLAQANKLAIEYFRTEGSKANNDNKLDEAISLLNASLKYGTDNDVYYTFANIYNKQKKYADAATNAQKGLDLEKGSPEAKAKFYYELAVAQLGNGDKEAACATFKNALYGPFVTPAKAQITNLKCNQ